MFFSRMFTNMFFHTFLIFFYLHTEFRYTKCSLFSRNKNPVEYVILTTTSVDSSMLPPNVYNYEPYSVYRTLWRPASKRKASSDSIVHWFSQQNIPQEESQHMKVSAKKSYWQNFETEEAAWPRVVLVVPTTEITTTPIKIKRTFASYFPPLNLRSREVTVSDDDDDQNDTENDDTVTEPLATEPSATEPSATEPSATEPPATEPLATEPPATEPSATEPPATEPSATEPLATEPPATEPLATEPLATEPSATEASATEPPATEPSATEPPATEPSATERPATERPATEPSATEPSAIEPSATEPPATEPSATEPPATEPSATEPPATEPSATEPPATEPSATEPPATEPSATKPPATEPPTTEKLTNLETSGDPGQPDEEDQTESSEEYIDIITSTAAIATTIKADGETTTTKGEVEEATTATTTTTTTTSRTTTTTTTTEAEAPRCYQCGLTDEEIPYKPTCYHMFDSDYPQFWHYKKRFRVTCGGNRKDAFDPSPSVPYKGGCFKRYVDIGRETYNERGCRTMPPLKGTSFASNRLMMLEKSIHSLTEGCVSSPFASLTPLSRAISLWARYHVCVCVGRYCNRGNILHNNSLILLFLSVLSCTYIAYKPFGVS